ncbi:MAG: PD-(D/E)XK nuclease family protein, partial [Bacteroidales bacterium]
KKIAPIDVERIRRWIVKGNMIYIAQNEKIFESESSILDLVFKVVCTPAEIAEYEVAILKELDKYLDSLEREFIYQYYLRINRLSKLNIPMEAATYFRFISKITSGIAVPFRGEPLSGLQVMGSLETRALDFENVIITSVNEGTFPSSNTAQSLIPYNLRCGFGLPTYELQDGIAAYHFYRSIARAKNVFLIYDTRSEGLNSGEVSRYVKQLKYHFNIKVEESVATAIPVIRDKKSVEVVKSPQVIKMLKDKYIYSKSSALSASALNNYITCPLKFYFENVEGVGDEEEVAESVESNTFGTLYHGAMQSIYDKYKYEIVSSDILKAEADNNKNLEAVIKQEFKKSLSINEVSGQNIIIMELLK